MKAYSVIKQLFKNSYPEDFHVQPLVHVELKASLWIPGIAWTLVGVAMCFHAYSVTANEVFQQFFFLKYQKKNNIFMLNKCINSKYILNLTGFASLLIFKYLPAGANEFSNWDTAALQRGSV